MNGETKRVQNIVLIALYTALIASVTVFTVIPFGVGGYFNLGDVAVMIVAAITPLRHAVFAASMGSMLADILSGYAQYAIFTGLIKGFMAYAVFKLLKRLKGNKFLNLFKRCRRKAVYLAVVVHCRAPFQYIRF